MSVLQTPRWKILGWVSCPGAGQVLWSWSSKTQSHFRSWSSCFPGGEGDPARYVQKGDRSWHRLPIEAVVSPSLKISKTKLDGALHNLDQWKMSLPMIFKVLSSPSVVLWTLLLRTSLFIAVGNQPGKGNPAGSSPWASHISGVSNQLYWFLPAHLTLGNCLFHKTRLPDLYSRRKREEKTDLNETKQNF